MYLRRLARKTAQERPEIAEALSSLLTQGLTRQSPLRGEATDLLPVDRDSRLELMRVEAPDDIDVAPLLPAEILRQLESVLSEREKEADLFKAGLAPTKSLLFTGPPGVGKTISAKWIAKKLGKPLLTLDLSAVMSSYLGRTGTNVRFVLDYAKQRECVLLLDELDAIAKRRDDGSEIGELKRLVTVLLQEIDDWPPTGLLIAATNHASLLDPAVWRRFELIVHFPLPDKGALQAFTERTLKPLGVADIAVHAIALAFVGGTLAELERELNRLHRQIVMGGSVPLDLVRSTLTNRMDQMQPEMRIDVAVGLVKSGFGQREVADMLHVSRDTIRKRVRGAGTKDKTNGK